MRVPQWAVPALVLLCAALGVSGARFLALPSVVKEISTAPSGAELRTVIFVVDGLKCVDTAERAAAQLDGMPGVVRFTGYASRNRAEVQYDPATTTPDAIRAAIEGPVADQATGEFLFGIYRVIEVDGVKCTDPKR